MTHQELLDYREKKTVLMEAFRNKHGSAMVAYRLNIPGPAKKMPMLEQIYRHGLERLHQRIAHENGRVLEIQEYSEEVEYLCLLAVQMEPHQLKEICIQFEAADGLGRLYDFDVYTSEGESITRNSMGEEERKCFVCDQNAFECARSRRHSFKELMDFVSQKAAQAFKNKEE